ncbi:MAG: energy transducer TonB [Thermoanaerobaculia bacterium]
MRRRQAVASVMIVALFRMAVRCPRVARRCQWKLLACVLIPLLLASSTLASGGIDSVKEDIQEIDELLLAHDWKKAHKKVRGLQRKLFTTVVGQGEGLLGKLASFDAIARAGLGDEHEALFMWEVSQQLFPEVSNLDLERYGSSVAETLRRDSLALAYPPPDPITSVEDEQEVLSPAEIFALDPSDEKYVPPRKVYAKPILHFDRLSQEDVRIIVECVVAVDGLPYRPKILGAAGDVTMVYSALQVFSTWRFKPGTLDGQPIPTVLTLDLNSRAK